MRTSHVMVLLSVAAMAVGCQRSTPNAVTLLPDTPVSVRPVTPPGQDVVDFSNMPGEARPDDPSQQLPDEVLALRKKIEAQDRLFADGRGRWDTIDREKAGEPRQDRPSAGAPLWSPPPSAPPRGVDRGSDDVRPGSPAARPPARPFQRPPSQPPSQPSPQPVAPLPVPPHVSPPATAGAPAPIAPAANKANGPRDQEYGSLDQSVAGVATTDADAIRRDLMQRVKDHPTDVAAHLNLQLFLFAREEPVPQLELLAPLPKEQRDMIATLMDGLVNFRHTVQTDPNALPSHILGPLLKMADLFRERTELTIPTIALCKLVSGFGSYEPMEQTFKAGLEYETIIYCEVENFSSQLNESQQWETKLSMEAVLYNSNGDAVLKGKDLVPTDLCRKRRHDFFVVKRLKLPATLAASRYILKVTIVDEHAKRIAENSLNIMMMAQ